MTPSTDLWLQQELAHLDLGDTRREKRCLLMVQRALDKPTASVLGACENTAEAKAAYRFLSNEAVRPEALLEALRAACLGRLPRQEMVLALQDTTSLDYATHPATQGLGPTGGRQGEGGHGLFMHTALAASSDGVPLGVLDHKTWARDPAAVGKRHQRRELALEDKESFRWLQTAQTVEEAVPPQLEVLHIADREGDIFELFAQPRRERSQLLVRAARENRCVQGPHQHLGPTVEAAPVAGEFELLVRRRPDRPTRVARLELRHCQVRLLPPQHGVHEPNLQPVTATAILLQQLGAPPDQPAVRWLLVTDLPVTDFEGARQCARYYSVRWLIERYHYTLKSGCRLEEAPLRTRDRLERLTALYCLVAWRLLWLTYSARKDGEQPCTLAFCQLEW
jgi:hypothetical protein